MERSESRVTLARTGTVPSKLLDSNDRLDEKITCSHVSDFEVALDVMIRSREAMENPNQDERERVFKEGSKILSELIKKHTI